MTKLSDPGESSGYATLTPSHIRRIGRIDPEEVLGRTLGRRFGRRFSDYRQSYHRTLAHDYNFVPDYPLTVLLELLNRCNLDCPMCYSAHRRGPLEEISSQTLDRLFDEFSRENLSAIMFGAGEEPLLYKAFDDVLGRCHDAGIMDIFVFTNGTLLTESRSRQLISSGVSRVFVSIDAASAEVYNQIRRRNAQVVETGDSRLTALRRNVRRLLELRQQMDSLLPLVRVSFVVQPLNAHEAEAFSAEWECLADTVEFQACSDYSFMPELGALGVEERWRRAPPSPRSEPLLCPQPFNTVTVWYNGDVSPCCEFVGKNITVGNIHRQSLKEIWHGEQISELRAQFRSGHINTVCRTCLSRRGCT